jgi:DNA (cytosine-5)-methyltransferase 1
MKVLNLYAGIGGNRKLWRNVEVTAIENNAEIAAIYQEYFPEDKIIVSDAHEYLLYHYKDFDFIWSSPPCQTHSRARMWTSKGGRYAPKYPDLKLWQEIIFMQAFCECDWVVENVKPYYKVVDFLPPSVEIDRHLFWSNFNISKIDLSNRISPWSVTSNTNIYGFNLSGRKIKHRKDQIIRNCINPELGNHILQCVINKDSNAIIKQPYLGS